MLHTPMNMLSVTGDADIWSTAQEMRNLHSALLNFPGGQGVAGAGAYAMAQRAAGANFSTDIAAGIALVNGDDMTGQGVYGLWSDATYNLDFSSIGAPPSGTRTHRVVLQVRDKSANAAYTTYDFLPMILQDPGSGTPAEPPSALTLGFVAIKSTDVSITTASITDKRRRVDDPAAYKAANTPLGTTTIMTADPDLALMGMSLGAVYEIRGLVIYDAGTVSLYQSSISLPTGATGVFTMTHQNNAGNTFPVYQSASGPSGSTLLSYGAGAGSPLPILITGTVKMGSSLGPLQWMFANQNSGGDGPTNYAGSYLVAKRIS